MKRRIQAVIFSGSLIAALLTVSAAPQTPGQTTPAIDKNITVMRAATSIVVVNVTVRDKQGNFIQDLKQSDFTVLEDAKPQQVVSMDIEKTDDIAVQQDTAQVAILMKDFGAAAPKPGAPKAAQPAAQPKEDEPVTADTFKDRRVVVLFF